METSRVETAQSEYFTMTESIPQSAWYWAAMASIAASATFWLAGKRDWGTFVGQWPPTFLLFALFHRFVRSSFSRT